MARQRELVRMAQEIDRDLSAIRQTIRRPAEAAFGRGGLTGPQRWAMQALAPSEGMSLKELSGHLGLAHSTVSGIVDRLEKQGLVMRRTDPRDRRQTRIVVTPKVRDFVREALPALAIHPLVEALRRGKPAERTQVLEGVKALRRLLRGDAD